MKENITFFIALVSCILSISSWAFTLITQRKSLAFHAYQYRSSNGITFVFISIENKSRLPVSITQIQIEIEGQLTKCEPFPTLIYETCKRQGSEVTERKTYYSMQMPISLPSLGGVSGYVLFQDGQLMPAPDAKHLNLRVHTNRGKVIRTTLLLPADKFDLRKKM